jgi:hypothetical protein
MWKKPSTKSLYYYLCVPHYCICVGIPLDTNAPKGRGVHQKETFHEVWPLRGYHHSYISPERVARNVNRALRGVSSAIFRAYLSTHGTCS